MIHTYILYNINNYYAHFLVFDICLHWSIFFVCAAVIVTVTVSVSCIVRNMYRDTQWSILYSVYCFLVCLPFQRLSSQPSRLNGAIIDHRLVQPWWWSWWWWSRCYRYDCKWSLVIERCYWWFWSSLFVTMIWMFIVVLGTFLFASY